MLYNYNDDKNWSGILFDATNGNVKAQIKGASMCYRPRMGTMTVNMFFSVPKRRDNPFHSPLR